MPMISSKDIAAIWKAHGLGRVERISPTASGSRNESYIVNHEFFIRFNTLDPAIPKFRNERVAYEILGSSTLPVPSLIAFDESRSIVPVDYIILTRLPGESITETWQQFSPARRQELAWSAGEMLARIHEHKVSGFGKLRDLDHPFPTWADCVHDYANRQASEATILGLLGSDVHARLGQVLDDASELLGNVIQGVVVHSDFHYENILQTEGQISGIVDFEWALAGDPSYDFLTAATRDEMMPGSEELFEAGYQSVRPIDAEHRKRVEIYELFYEVEKAVGFASPSDEGGRGSLRELLQTRFDASYL
jgi:aminoglycoside phosphotransferase (APT) family kinase protein